MSPFLAELILIAIHNDYHLTRLKEIPTKDIQWGLFLSTVIWSYGGFDSMGSLAGEVKGGRRTFVQGITGSMPLIIANYFVPVILGYSINSNHSNWVSGYFTTLAYKEASWLGAWMVAASALSNFGQYNAAMAPLSRVVWAMARDKNSQKLPSILGWSHRRHTGTIRPVAAVLFTGLMSAVLAELPFNLLVQIFLIVRILNLGLEYAALIKLRYSEPNAPRPFEVPGGMVGVCLLPIPSAILAVFALVFTSWQVWVIGISTNAIIILLYFISRLVWKIAIKVSSRLSTHKSSVQS